MALIVSRQLFLIDRLTDGVFSFLLLFFFFGGID